LKTVEVSVDFRLEGGHYIFLETGDGQVTPDDSGMQTLKAANGVNASFYKSV
jgi:hypothetical protein